MYKPIYLLPILLLFLTQGCVEPTVETANYNSEVVVDGWIEPGKYCQVLLTLSAPYFADIDSVSLRNYALTKAKVTVSNGAHSEILTLKPNEAYFPPYLYISTKIKGEVGKNYDITVEYGGRTTYATTTIPEPVKLDSAWFALDEESDSLGFVWLKFMDDATKKNYYRTLTQIKNVDNKYIPNYFPNFNDEFFNGQRIEVSLYKGNSNSIDKIDDFHYKIGDTISLKFCTVDKASFVFWNSFQKEILNTGNPFASTNARVTSNVSNGLGVWCGYGSSYYRIIAK